MRIATSAAPTGTSNRPSACATAEASAVQREEPVDASGRTHGIRHQADIRFGHQGWPERQLYEVQLTSGCGWAVSLRQRLLPSRANWRYCLGLFDTRPRVGTVHRMPRT